VQEQVRVRVQEQVWLVFEQPVQEQVRLLDQPF
jgi:hypothetical protein